MYSLEAKLRVPRRLILMMLVVGLLIPVLGHAQEATPEPAEATGIIAKVEALLTPIDAQFGVAVKYVEAVLFWRFGLENGIPLIIVVLVCGGIFFSTWYGFINIRLFGHAIALVRGKYDDPDDEGEISHFQALTSALAATVGLGNIAGVAVAISMGGPGAVFWMWCTAFFGMSLKFTSCTLAQVYRRIDDEGRVLGGPMVYLKEGIKECAPSFVWLGAILSPVFAILTVLAALGGGNMFQSNQTYALAAEIFGMQDSGIFKLVVGVVLATLVGVVIIGGIKKIGDVTAKLVPLMCIGYVIVCLTILFANYSVIPGLFLSIIVQAFNPEAVYGGFLGVMIIGMRRAAFSNEAGLGSASIAHAAAKTNEPIREGLVAMLEPFIDTIVVCTMTALAILATGAHLSGGSDGVVITMNAFESLWPGLKYFLGITVFVFAYSTMITWCYYGEKAVETLLGKSFIVPYRYLFISAIVLAPLLSLQNVLAFSDALLLSMAFPNIIGTLFLVGKVNKMKNDYISRLRSGEMKRVN